MAMTGATRAGTRASGNAVLQGRDVQIRQATTTTLNQVRAVRYIPLVVHRLPQDRWYVIPPQIVVAAVCLKARGQHTENPFESANLSLDDFEAYEVKQPGEKLRDATLRAAEDGDRFPELHEAMGRIVQRSRELAEQARDEVIQILRNRGV
jgi:hypothetical protein